MAKLVYKYMLITIFIKVLCLQHVMANIIPRHYGELKSTKQIEDAFSDIVGNQALASVSFATYRSQKYTTICWNEKTTLHFFNNGTTYGYTEYSISMEVVPTLIPIEYDDVPTETYEIEDPDTKESRKLDFITVDKNDFETVKQNRTLLCRSGKSYSKSFIDLPKKKKVEIRLKRISQVFSGTRNTLENSENNERVVSLKNKISQRKMPHPKIKEESVNKAATVSMRKMSHPNIKEEGDNSAAVVSTKEMTLANVEGAAGEESDIKEKITVDSETSDANLPTHSSETSLQENGSSDHEFAPRRNPSNFDDSVSVDLDLSSSIESSSSNPLTETKTITLPENSDTNPTLESAISSDDTKTLQPMQFSNRKLPKNSFNLHKETNLPESTIPSSSENDDDKNLSSSDQTEVAEQDANAHSSTNLSIEINSNEENPLSKTESIDSNSNEENIHLKTTEILDNVDDNGDRIALSKDSSEENTQVNSEAAVQDSSLSTEEKNQNIPGGISQRKLGGVIVGKAHSLQPKGAVSSSSENHQISGDISQRKLGGAVVGESHSPQPTMSVASSTENVYDQNLSSSSSPENDYDKVSSQAAEGADQNTNEFKSGQISISSNEETPVSSTLDSKSLYEENKPEDLQENTGQPNFGSVVGGGTTQSLQPSIGCKNGKLVAKLNMDIMDGNSKISTVTKEMEINLDQPNSSQGYSGDFGIDLGLLLRNYLGNQINKCPPAQSENAGWTPYGIPTSGPLKRFHVDQYGKYHVIPYQPDDSNSFFGKLSSHIKGFVDRLNPF